jgi:hypothetical protein
MARRCRLGWPRNCAPWDCCEDGVRRNQWDGVNLRRGLTVVWVGPYKRPPATVGLPWGLVLGGWVVVGLLIDIVGNEGMRGRRRGLPVARRGGSFGLGLRLWAEGVILRSVWWPYWVWSLCGGRACDDGPAI